MTPTSIYLCSKIWENEPIASGDPVKVCGKELTDGNAGGRREGTEVCDTFWGVE